MLDNLIENCVSVGDDTLTLSDEGTIAGFKTITGGTFPVLLQPDGVRNVRNWLNEWLKQNGIEDREAQPTGNLIELGTLTTVSKAQLSCGGEPVGTVDMPISLKLWAEVMS